MKEEDMWLDCDWCETRIVVGMDICRLFYFKKYRFIFGSLEYYPYLCYMKNKDWTKATDKEILDIIDIKKNKGGIPYVAVQESQKRGLKKYVNRTINSHDFDENGKWISE